MDGSDDALDTTVTELVAELERRFPFASALMGAASGIRVGDSGTEHSASEVDPTRGIVFTVYDGYAFDEIATTALVPDDLAREVRAWASTLKPRSGGPALPPPTQTEIAAESASQVAQVAMLQDPAQVSLAAKLDLAAALQRRAQAADPRIVRAQVGYQDEARETAYFGQGRHLRQRVTRVTLTCAVVAADGQHHTTHFVQRGGTGGFELATITDDEVSEMVQTALRLLEAEKIAPGVYDVVTDQTVSGIIAHECFGHGVEMDLFPKGRARSAQYLGKSVAAAAVQMYDDPSYAGGYGSYFFDDLGEIARPTQILRDGILVSPISDLASAAFAGGARTANTRRQDITRKAYARMSNTFFGAGESSREELLASLDNGIYLRQGESGMEDPMGWGIQVTVHYGEEYQHGRPTGRLFAPIGISGYVPDLLHSITMIGNDLALSPGFCGKGHKEYVPVATGGPHLRMKARLG